MGDVEQIEGSGEVGDSRIALVVSRYNSFIVDRLLEGCLNTLMSAGVKRANVRLIKVPGAFEIPVAVKSVADRKKRGCHHYPGCCYQGRDTAFRYYRQRVCTGYRQHRYRNRAADNIWCIDCGYCRSGNGQIR